jgi:hypothetical protein
MILEIRRRLPCIFFLTAFGGNPLAMTDLPRSLDWDSLVAQQLISAPTRETPTPFTRPETSVQ